MAKRVIVIVITPVIFVVTIIVESILGSDDLTDDI